MSRCVDLTYFISLFCAAFFCFFLRYVCVFFFTQSKFVLKFVLRCVLSFAFALFYVTFMCVAFCVSVIFCVEFFHHWYTCVVYFLLGPVFFALVASFSCDFRGAAIFVGLWLCFSFCFCLLMVAPVLLVVF